MSSSFLHMSNGDDSYSSCDYINLAYDPANSDESAKALIYALRPEWESSEGDVEFVRFKEGITNSLFKAIKKRPGWSERELDNEAVMVRAYGNGTDLIIDREREAKSHSLLAKHHLAPPLYARFDNGLLYKYIEGEACSSEDLRQPGIVRAIARLLGIWHATLPISEAVGTPLHFEHIAKYLSGKPQTNLWTVMQKWITALPSETKQQRERNSKLQVEVEQATKLLGNTPGLNNGDYILGHCDLLSGNVIILPDESHCEGCGNSATDVNFIDYEYATPVPAAFDVANHFAEWGGFDCDYTVLPTRRQRRDFVKEYVRSYRFHHKRSTRANSCGNTQPYTSSEEHDIDNLMAEVDAFRGMPGLYWGIWALIQATISEIDFDYASYAEVRLAEYWAWKAEMDGSRERNGEKMSIREQRLAQEE